MENNNITRYPLHLGLGAKATAQPEFNGMQWYEAYARRCEDDGAEGRLVTIHSFTEDWDSWEMHPSGDEVVLCLSGQITLLQEHADGTSASVTLGPNEYVVNPPGCWHTADIAGEATALFITAGLNTQHRPR